QTEPAQGNARKRRQHWLQAQAGAYGHAQLMLDRQVFERVVHGRGGLSSSATTVDLFISSITPARELAISPRLKAPKISSQPASADSMTASSSLIAAPRNSARLMQSKTTATLASTACPCCRDSRQAASAASPAEAMRVDASPLSRK